MFLLPARIPSRPRPLAIALLAALSAASVGAVADPGDLDLRFADDGVLFLGAGGQDERVNSLLPDHLNGAFAGGRFPSIGVTIPRGLAAKGGSVANDMTVFRLRADGSLDPGWGENGIFQAGLGGIAESVNDMTRQPDGAIIAAGALQDDAYTDFGVVRITPAGGSDHTFGVIGPNKGVFRSGYVTVNLGPTDPLNDEATAVALQSDGRIVVAGIAKGLETTGTYSRFGLTRLSAVGDVDLSFGNGAGDSDGDGLDGNRNDGADDGKRIENPLLDPLTSEIVSAIAKRRNGRLAANDSITVVGYVQGGSNALVRRYTANGALDPTFGTGGVVTLTSTSTGGVTTGMYRIDDAVLLEDGRLVLVGRGNDRGYAFMRLMPNGAVDTSFGTNGRTHVKFSGPTYEDEPQALTLQADGKLVAAGSATSLATGGPRLDFASVRLLPNGTPDTSYGDGSGRSTYPLSTEADVAYAVTVTSDGSLLHAGDARVDEVVDNEGAFLRLQGDPRIFANGFED